MSNSYSPIFIICTGRSGSTLLQYIMDAHPLIDAPQELHLGPMIKKMILVFNRLNNGKFQSTSNGDKRIYTDVRNTVEDIVRSHLKSPIWCDKSVSSIDHLDEIMAVFPDARYIFLYRDCLDFVHSALEVSKYGFEGFGFEEFVLKNPKNMVDGLVNFWCHQTEKRKALIDTSYKIHEVNYEDIVKNTIPTLTKLFQFLELDFDEKMLLNLFEAHRPGGGDLKVQSSNKIKDNTGKGRLVPIKHIKEKTFRRMNEALLLVGYSTVGKDFNFTQHQNEISDEVKNFVVKQISAHFDSRLQESKVPTSLDQEMLVIDVSGEDNPTWRIDFQIRECIFNPKPNEKVTIHIKLRLETLLKIVEDKLNISMAYREGCLKTNATYEKLNEIGKFLFD
ncbi:MAG: sulfotransferase [Saprospiraceae bacterium]|nr:sulfotransferase [Saprospiraceae bacterium]